MPEARRRMGWQGPWRHGCMLHASPPRGCRWWAFARRWRSGTRRTQRTRTCAARTCCSLLPWGALGTPGRQHPTAASADQRPGEGHRPAPAEGAIQAPGRAGGGGDADVGGVSGWRWASTRGVLRAGPMRWGGAAAAQSEQYGACLTCFAGLSGSHCAGGAALHSHNSAGTSASSRAATACSNGASQAAGVSWGGASRSLVRWSSRRCSLREPSSGAA